LKRAARDFDILRQNVAPCAGAWIETHHRHATQRPIGSPPARGRGLKQYLPIGNIRLNPCRPLRGGVD